MNKNEIDIEPKGFDLQPIKTLNRKYKMKALFNWKTTLLGLAIFAVKAIEGTGIISPDIASWLLATLTGLLGLVAGDGSNKS